MNSTSATAIILSSLSQYGSAILIILGAVIGIGLGMLVFRFGWFQVKKSTGTKVTYDEDGAGSDGSYRDPLIGAYLDGEKPRKRKRRTSDDPF